MKNKLQAKLEEDALLMEVIEDVKNEQLQQIWNKYGLAIIISVALILTAAISFESLKSWYHKKQQELSNAYSIALSLQNQGRLDESIDVYKTLVEKASGIYVDLARLQIADIYFRESKNEDAIQVLQLLISDNSATKQIRDIAAIKLAAYKLDNNGSADDVKALLLPLISGDNISNVANELLAMLYVRENNIQQAIDEYKKISLSSTASDILKNRSLDMINILEQ